MQLQFIVYMLLNFLNIKITTTQDNTIKTWKILITNTEIKVFIHVFVKIKLETLATHTPPPNPSPAPLILVQPKKVWHKLALQG